MLTAALARRKRKHAENAEYAESFYRL